MGYNLDNSTDTKAEDQDMEAADQDTNSEYMMALLEQHKDFAMECK